MFPGLCVLRVERKLNYEQTYMFVSMCRGWFELNDSQFSDEFILSTWLEMISL